MTAPAKEITSEREERSVMQRFLAAAGWDAGSLRHKQMQDALDGAHLELVARQFVAPVTEDDGSGDIIYPHGVVCHAPGDRCLGCPHYHGRADSCVCATPAVEAWQDIATAPKDRVGFLFYVPVDEKRNVIDTGYFDGKRVRAVNFHGVDDPIVDATHWMPLPAAPGSTNVGSFSSALAEAEEALAFYASDTPWRLGGQCDPNSSNFNGQMPAREALAAIRAPTSRPDRLTEAG